MAGSVIITVQSPYRGPVCPCTLVTLAWTSDASGAVSGNLTDYLAGELSRVVFIPGTGGSQPSNDYTVALYDASDIDLLSGLGASLSHTASSDIAPCITRSDGTNVAPAPRFINDKLDLVVSGAGNAKSGSILLYIR